MKTIDYPLRTNFYREDGNMVAMVMRENLDSNTWSVWSYDIPRIEWWNKTFRSRKEAVSFL